MNYYTNAIGTTLAIVLGILLICMLIPAQQAVVSRTVTQDACAANSAEELIVMLEFAMTATEDDLEAVTLVGTMKGMLWYFEPGDIVFPTGQVEYYDAIDGALKVIQVTSPSISGEWWMFEMQTR